MAQRNRTLTLLFFALLVTLESVAQTQYAYRVTFRDKTGSPALSANPAWLSSRSMARRNNFNIALDSTDRPVSPVYIDSVLRLTGGVVHTKSRWLNQLVVLLNDSSRRQQLAGKSFISNVEWIGYFANGLHQKTSPGQTGGGPGAGPATGAKTTGDPAHYGSAWAMTDFVHGDYLHDQGLTGRGKLIAVIDEGFSGVETQQAFAEMRNNGRLLDTHNFLYNTGNVFVNGYHGTNCLSPLAANRPGFYVGAAPDADYALYITEDGQWTDAVYELDNLIAAMERADSVGADVISASIVYNIFVSPFSSAFSKAELDGHTTNVARAANLAVGKGIVYVSSAGNEGNNAWNFLDSPGDADSVLTVGSVGIARGASAFSSPGPNASGRVKPDVCLLGESVPVYDAWGNIYSQMGTSFAAPQLAGYVACLLQANSKARPFVIRNAVQRCADRYNQPTDKLGYGIPDFRNALQHLRVAEASGGSAFTLAPNPFGSALRVIFTAYPGPASFRLFDPSGRTIAISPQQESGGVHLIEVPAELPAGVYFLEAQINGERITKRVLRMN